MIEIDQNRLILIDKKIEIDRLYSKLDQKLIEFPIVDWILLLKSKLDQNQRSKLDGLKSELSTIRS